MPELSDRLQAKREGESTFSLFGTGGALGALALLPLNAAGGGLSGTPDIPDQLRAFTGAGDTNTSAVVQQRVSQADVLRALTQVHDDLLSRSEALDPEEEAVLYDNLWELYA